MPATDGFGPIKGDQKSNDEKSLLTNVTSFMGQRTKQKTNQQNELYLLTQLFINNIT